MTTSSYSTYLYEKNCVFLVIFHKMAIVYISQKDIFSFLIDILPSAKLTGGHIQNGYFFDSLFFTWLCLSSAMQQLMFQQTYFLFLRWLLFLQTQYQNMTKSCEDIVRQIKNLRNLRKVVAICKMNKLVLSKSICP